jgi:Fe-S cluster assembly protein SufD
VTSEVLASRALTRETVQSISARRQEPEWLLELRLRAFHAFEAMPLPDQRTEGWRRTSLRGLPLDAITPPGGPSDFEAQASGQLRVLELREALRDPALADRVQQHLGNIVAHDANKFTALHYAFFNTGVVVYVPRNAAIERAVWLKHAFEAGFVHTLVIIEEGAQLALVEDFQGAPQLTSGVVEQVVGANAHLRYVHLQRFGNGTWNFSWQRAQLARDASLRTLNVALGGRTSRNTVQVVLDGRGSQADLLGIVRGQERQHFDFQTLQDHFGDATRSDLVIHDALRDRASANFTGLIRINKSARQTESSQEQKNILLSDHARADSDPKLEILNNDVIRCTHGAAVGPVDEELVFYLQSRGLDRAEAEQLIVEGFFRSVLERVGVPDAHEAVWEAITG